eukprot:scaffold9393_cov66-Phaeocystis_antarctica.AAC.7
MAARAGHVRPRGRHPRRISSSARRHNLSTSSESFERNPNHNPDPGPDPGPNPNPDPNPDPRPNLTPTLDLTLTPTLLGEMLEKTGP